MLRNVSATHIRSHVIESAKQICERVQGEGDEPCSACIYTASVMHARFWRGLPSALRQMPPEVLSAAIRAAGHDA